MGADARREPEAMLFASSQRRATKQMPHRRKHWRREVTCLVFYFGGARMNEPLMLAE